jgi:maltose-binding protein MalE
MSRKVGKSLLLLGIFFFLYLFISNCSNRSSQKILLWSSLRPVERELLQEKLDIFSNRYPDYEFSQLFYNPEELRTNFIISALAGKGPPLMHCPSDFIGPLSELEVIKPLQDLFEKQFLDSFLIEPFPANTIFQGNLYQIADRIGNHLCLVYNKDMIETPPATISELINLGNRFVKDEDGDGKTDSYVLAWNFMEPFFAIPFIGGYGGWILDEKNNPTLNTPEIEKASQLISDLVRKHKITPQECDYETANALFLDRRVAMIINGPWSWGTYINNGINLGLARIPKIDETGLWPSPMVSPMGFVVNINEEGERLHITLELIKYLTQSNIELEFSKKFGIIPSRKDALNSPEITQNEVLNQALDQLLVGKLMPVVTELRWIWDAMRPAYQAVFTNRLTPKEASAEMQRLAEKLISENRE